MGRRRVRPATVHTVTLFFFRSEHHHSRGLVCVFWRRGKRDNAAGNLLGAEALGEYIECACSGVMACSTCHVVVDPAWFPIVGPPPPEEVTPPHTHTKHTHSPTHTLQHTHTAHTHAHTCPRRLLLLFCADRHDRPGVRAVRDLTARLPNRAVQGVRRSGRHYPGCASLPSSLLSSSPSYVPAFSASSLLCLPPPPLSPLLSRCLGPTLLTPDTNCGRPPTESR